MSQIYVPNVGEAYLLKSGTVTNNFSLGLFQNDLSVSHGTVLGDITAANYTGYAVKTLTAANWAHTIEGNKAHAEYAQQNFVAGTIGTSNTIYGVYCYYTTILVFVEVFDEAVVVDTTGQVISYVPVIEAATA